MAENGMKMSLDNYLNLDMDRLSSSDGSNEEESHKKLKTGNNSSKRISSEPRSENGYGKMSLAEIPSLENFEKDLARRMEPEKMVLIEFTEKAMNIYSTKFMELIRKQEMEKRELKKKFVEAAKFEIKDWKKCLNRLRQEEVKLMKILSHLKKLYDSPQFQQRRLKKLADIHTDFIQKYQELLTKHNSEVESLKEVINDEVSEVKINLSQEFWEKESEMEENSFDSDCSQCEINL